jgi:tripartite-type tricarboxylate transporter receptor subunit TctC
MWAPKNTPREIRAKIATDIRAIVVGADWQAIMEAQGYTGVGSSPEEFLTFWKLEGERLGKAIERASIRVS